MAACQRLEHGHRPRQSWRPKSHALLAHAAVSSRARCHRRRFQGDPDRVEALLGSSAAGPSTWGAVGQCATQGSGAARTADLLLQFSDAHPQQGLQRCLHRAQRLLRAARLQVGNWLPRNWGLGERGDWTWNFFNCAAASRGRRASMLMDGCPPLSDNGPNRQRPPWAPSEPSRRGRII